MDRATFIALKHRVCGCLLRIDTIADRDRRNLYFATLEDQFGQSLPATRYTDAKHDIWSITSACLNHPGLLRAFIEIIRAFNGESTSLAKLQQYVDQLEPPVEVTSAELDATIPTSGYVPPDQVGSELRTATDQAWLHVPPDWPEQESLAGTTDQTATTHGDRLSPAQSPGVGTPAERHTLGDWPGRRPPTDANDPLRNPVPSQRTPDESLAMPQPPTLARQDHGPSFRGGVPLRNPDFAGRQTLLRKLRQELEFHGTRSVVPQVLHGPGGVGKTQLAVEYIHLYASAYRLVWWVPADRAERIERSLCRLGDQLGFPPNPDPAQRAVDVIDSLSASPYSWLLIYDNATDPDVVGPLVPSFGGHVVLTSRNAEWATRWSTIEVDVLNRQDSVSLLLQRHPGSSPSTAHQLADRLGDLPLALAQAANFQVVTGLSMADYLRLFDGRGLELLDEGRPCDYPTTLTSLVREAFAALADEQPPAAELLGMFAFLGPEPLPADMLRHGMTPTPESPREGLLGDEITLGQAIRALSRWGLAKVNPDRQRIQVSRLLQDMIRAVLPDSLREQRCDQVRSMLAAANPADPEDEATWPAHAEIRPHILAADLIHADTDHARQVVLDQARSLFLAGEHGASHDLARSMVDVWCRPVSAGGLGREHEQSVQALLNLANPLRGLGEYDQARRIGEEAYELVLNSPRFGDNHRSTIQIALGLGFDLPLAGDFSGALRIAETNRARALRVCGVDHDLTSRANSNVAVALRLLGRYQEAHDMSSATVERDQEMRGSKAPLTLSHISELVLDLCGLGRYKEALDRQLETWELYRQTFDPHQRERLSAERNIVIALRKTGGYGKAHLRGREHYRIAQSHYGPNHELTLIAGMSFTNALRAAGRLIEAREIGETTRVRCESRFGPRHPLTLAAQINFGIILRQLDEQRQAHDLEHETYRALQDTLGDEHLYTLAAATNYANSLAAEHQLEAARDLTWSVMERSRTVRGPRHPDTLAAMINAALDTPATDSASTGPQLFASAVKQFEEVLGRDHPETVTARARSRMDCDVEPPPI